jgi:hypothetical protein
VTGNTWSPSSNQGQRTLGVPRLHRRPALLDRPGVAGVLLACLGQDHRRAPRLHSNAVDHHTTTPPRHTADEERELDREAAEDSLVTTRLEIRDAVVVGISQTAALLAGISRSGITMVAGLVRGLDHETAVNFSFLLATPIIFAAGVLKLPDLANPAAAGIRGPTIAGALVAFVAASLSVRFLTRYLERRSLYPFAAYCLVAGPASIVMFA